MTYNGNLLAYAGDGAGEPFHLFVPLLLACVISTPAGVSRMSTSAALLAWVSSALMFHV